MEEEIRRRILQANGFPFFFAALVVVGAFAAAKVLSAFWATFKSVLPCLATLPCLQADLTFEGVPSFEDALMTDKLVGARTYEMRDMPKYRDFFFESKSPATTPKRKTAGGAFADALSVVRRFDAENREQIRAFQDEVIGKAREELASIPQ